MSIHMVARVLSLLIGATVFSGGVILSTWMMCTLEIFYPCRFAINDVKFTEAVVPLTFVLLVLFVTGVAVAFVCGWITSLFGSAQRNWILLGGYLLVGSIIGPLPLLVWDVVMKVSATFPAEVYLTFDRYIPLVLGGIGCSLVGYGVKKGVTH